MCETTLQLYDEVQRHWTNVWEQPESEEADASAYHSQMIQACFNLGFEVSSGAPSCSHCLHCTHGP